MAHGHWEGESTLRDHRGGRPIPVAISSFVMLHPVTREPMALATVQRDITERLIAQSALQDLADQRQELLDRLVQAQEDERARIAADVHDDSVQALAAVELRLGLLRRRLAERAPDLVESVDQMAETVEHRDRPAPPPALRPGLPRAARRPRRRARPGRVVRLRGRPGLDASPATAPSTCPRACASRRTGSPRRRWSTSASTPTRRKATIELCRLDGGVEVRVTDDGRGLGARRHPRPARPPRRDGHARPGRGRRRLAAGGLPARGRHRGPALAAGPGRR